MSRRRALLLGVVSVAISILGCDLGSSSTHCSSPPEGCPRSTFATEMTRGEITYRVRSGEPITSDTVQLESTSLTEGCSIDGLTGEIFSDEKVVTIGPGVHCRFPDGYLYISLYPLSDIRNWPIGSHPVPGSNAMLIELCDRPGRTGRGCTFCRPQLDSALVTVVVEEAEGRPAPYPDMVTPDYRRRYRIEVETGALSADECDGMTVSLTLDLQQTAAQFVHDPHGACMPCH